MSADFNAGSIEGTLDLDTSPFRAGMLKAKAQADDFEHKDIRPDLDLEKGEFDAKKDEAKAQLDELGTKKAEPEVKLKGLSGVLAGLGLVRHEVRKTEHAGGGVAWAGIAIRIGLLVPALLAVVAAAGPATAALLALGAAGAVAFGGAVIALGLFAASVKSALGPILAANKAGKDLSGWAGKVQDSLKGMTGAWGDLQKTVRPEMFKFLNTVFSGLAGVIPKLAPLLKTVTTGMTGVVKSIMAVTKTPLFTQFLKDLQKFMGGFLNGLGPLLAGALKTFMHLFHALAPLMHMLGRGIERASKAAEHFSSGKGLDKFLSKVQKFLPLLGHLVTDLVKGLGHLGAGLAPLSGPALKAIDGIVKAIGGLDLTPLSKGLGDLLDNLRPLLPVLQGLVQKGLNLLGPALSAVGHALGFIEKHQSAVAVLVGLGTVVGIIKAIALATKLWAAAQVLLDAALDANPIGIVVVALAGLVAGLIYAYKHSEKFRAIVNGAFHAVASVAKSVFHWLSGAVSAVVHFIEGHWKLLLGILTGPIGAAAIFIISHWHQITGMFSSGISAIKSIVSNGLDAVLGFFRSLPGRIAAGVGAMLAAGRHLLSGVWDGMKQIGSEILSWAASLPGRVIAAIGNIGSAIVGHIKSSISGAAGAVGGKIGSVISHIPGLATGGVTTGPMSAIIGDNPGGREAVIPLDQYDLPKKGESTVSGRAQAKATDALHATMREVLATLRAIKDKTATSDDIAEATGRISDNNMRAMVQIARAT